MKKNKLLIIFVSFLILANLVVSCKDENVERVGVCPVVTSTNPVDLAVGVPQDQIITVTFNEPMNPVTIVPAAFTLQGPGTTMVTGTLTYNAGNATMSFKPASLLQNGVTYTGTVATSVKDLMGNALQTPYIWTFTPGTLLSPTVIDTDPDMKATNVFLNKRMTATFSRVMDPLSLTTTTFTVKQGTMPITGAVSYFGSTATFAPSANLAPNTEYTCTITTGAKDKAGIPMLNDFVWTFTTGTAIAPYVTLTDPTDKATGVQLNKIITATFSEAMDMTTLSQTSFVVKTGTQVVAGVVNYSGMTATFIPDDNLLSGATYVATITTGAKNPVGTPIANDYIWSFNTVATLGGPFVDLKSVLRFGIIAGVGVSNNAGFSKIRNMDVGISPGVRASITGFPPATIENGAIYASNDIAPAGVAAMLITAKQDLTDAYLFAEGATTPAPVTVAGDLGGTTLAPGIYKTTSTLLIQSGNLTLDAKGDVNAVWIFQIASGFTTVGGAGGSVLLIGGAQAKNIFWQTGSSATIGDLTSFKGNILALTSITMNSSATAEGRMLARNGSVVMTNTNIIDRP